MIIDTNKKLAGILVPAFALRTKDDLGIGDTQAVKEAIDFCHVNNFGVLQLLPINETGGDNSPYNAISAMALDPVYIHFSKQALDMIPGLIAEDLNDAITSSATIIDYSKVKNTKNSLLQKAFARYEAGKVKNFISLNNEFKLFQSNNKNWLQDYSLFRAIVDLKNGNARWTEWEPDLRNVDLARGWIDGREQIERKKICLFYNYVQWIAHRQWSAIKDYAQKQQVKLIGDIPFGVSRYSADVWANANLFDLEWSGGAPPERFFQADKFTSIWGQNWGIPLYKWSAHEKENYRWWNSRIQQVTKYFHGFRLDHVLGFFRIYAFPWLPENNLKFTDLTSDEAKIITGGNMPGFKPRNDDTKNSSVLNCQEGEIRLKAILQGAPESIVIAEDLGLVPEYVRPSLKKLGIPGFSIPLFERNEIDRSFLPSDKLPALNLTTYGTHDNEPLASYYEKLVHWWHSEDGHNGWLEMQRLMRFLHLDQNSPPLNYNDELACTFFKVLFLSPCWLAVLMITDLLGTKQCFNRPGTSNSSNWSERLEKPLAEYILDKKYAKKIVCAREFIVQTNRQPCPLSKSHLSELSAPK
jgi:4-alpha-glucanotransferase